MDTKLICIWAALALASLGLAAQGSKSDSMAKWESMDYRTQLVSEPSLAGTNAALVRGIIFGKHGRVFKEKEVQAYLDSRPWYKRNPTYSNSELNENERKNLDTVREFESKLHKKIEPGDMRFWEDQGIDETQPVRDLTSVHIMKEEIEAIHGKTFSDEPELQAYFNDRYWYKPDPTYNSKSLDSIEKDNLEVLTNLERRLKGEVVGPGDMNIFENRPLTEKALEQCSLMDLRLMRNELYARRGYKFKTPWLQRHFGMQDWYKPKSSTVILTGVEKANVAVILKRETEIHEDLASKPLSEHAIDGLYIEDLTKLQNEIYAKHGKVFKQKWLQSYFESLPWYKPDPSFKVASLTKIEKDNLQMLAEASKDASSVMNAEEG